MHPWNEQYSIDEGGQAHIDWTHLLADASVEHVVLWIDEPLQVPGFLVWVGSTAEVWAAGQKSGK